MAPPVYVDGVLQNLGQRFGRVYVDGVRGGGRVYVDGVGQGGISSLINFATGTFSRASVATWWNGTILTRYAINQLRQPENINGRRAFVIEGARTNFCRLSSACSGAAWSTPNSIVTADQFTSPAGDASAADQVEFIADGASRIVYEPPDQPADSVWTTVSQWGRRVSGDWTAPPELRGRNKAGTQSRIAYPISDDWFRQRLAVNTVTGANTTDLRATNTAATARFGSFWGAQYELGAFASSHIETAGANGTRSDDDLEVDVTGNPILTEGFIIHIRPSFSSAEHTLHAVAQRFLSLQNLHFLRFTATAVVQLGGALGNVGASGLTWSAGQDLTITVDFSAAEMTLSGFTTGDGVTDITAAGDWAGNTTMQVGNIAALTQPFFGLITEPYPL